MGASASARALLSAAVDGEAAFELEAHDHSLGVAFACITAGVYYVDRASAAQIHVRQVQLDFADFEQLHGSREAVIAFDPGFAVLHELVHGLLNLPDAVGDPTLAGACDEQVNRMRHELGLPKRQGYSPRLRSVVTPSEGTKLQAELVFVHASLGTSHTGTERLYMRWDVERIGSNPAPSVRASETAVVR